MSPNILGPPIWATVQLIPMMKIELPIMLTPLPMSKRRNSGRSQASLIPMGNSARLGPFQRALCKPLRAANGQLNEAEYIAILIINIWTFKSMIIVQLFNKYQIV